MKNTAFIKIPAIPDDVDISDAAKVFESLDMKPRGWFIFLYKNEIYSMTTQCSIDSEITYLVEKETMYFDKKDRYVADQHEINEEISNKYEREIRNRFEERLIMLSEAQTRELEMVRENYEKRMGVIRRNHRDNSVDRKLLLESIAAATGKTLNFNE